MRIQTHAHTGRRDGEKRGVACRGVTPITVVVDVYRTRTVLGSTIGVHHRKRKDYDGAIR